MAGDLLPWLKDNCDEKAGDRAYVGGYTRDYGAAHQLGGVGHQCFTVQEVRGILEAGFF